MDFFTVPTVTGRILFVFVVILHHRRRIVHFNVTEHPTAAGYLAYYHGSRTHLSLAKDAPTTRRVQGATEGDVIAFREVGGLHHRYERRVA